MRIIATLLVRDEIDVLPATIEHLLAAGVDHLVVTDNGSVDGSAELLERYRDVGVVDLIHEPDHNYEQSRWVTRMARRAAARHGADWVINADADEFLWPCELVNDASALLSLHPGPVVSFAATLEAIPPDIGTIVARRQNLLADPTATGAWPDRLIWREGVSRSERGTPIGPKTIHRADPDVLVAQGNHAASGPLIGGVLDGEPLVILHVPDRGYDQFERKILNGGASLDSTDLPPEVGWHWRADYERLTSGTLQEVWAARQLDRDSIIRRCRAGEVVEDHRLAVRIDQLADRALLPDALERVRGRTHSEAGLLAALRQRWQRRPRRQA